MNFKDVIRWYKCVYVYQMHMVSPFGVASFSSNFRSSLSHSHSLSSNIVFVFFFPQQKRVHAGHTKRFHIEVLYEKGKPTMRFNCVCIYVLCIHHFKSHTCYQFEYYIIIITYFTPFETPFLKITFSFIWDVSQYKSIHINNRLFQN